MDILYKEESYSIIGAAMDVHKELGHCFLEAVYQEALEKEFNIRNIPYIKQAPLTIYYKNEPLDKKYIADFICYDKIIIEIKAVSKIISEHEGQIINYMAATKMNLGIIINFGSKSLEQKRIVK